LPARADDGPDGAPDFSIARLQVADPIHLEGIGERGRAEELIDDDKPRPAIVCQGVQFSHRKKRAGKYYEAIGNFFPAGHARPSCAARSTLNLNRRKVMLWTIFVILLVLWLLGLVGGYAFGGFIHILLVLAVIVLIINLVSGRRGV
jgi:hypothetical protein